MTRELFADTANLEEIKELYEMGIISGVTTNPSIIAKEPKSEFLSLIKEISQFCGKNKLSFSVEVFTTNPEDIYTQGKQLSEELLKTIQEKFLHIKVPIGLEELKIINRFSAQGINVNCTACFTEEQMKLAALSGSRYVSLFFNRARDSGIDVCQVLRNTNKFIEENNLHCKIIAGSIRKPSDITEAWNNGAHIVTCSTKIIKEMVFHEGTNKSIEGFMKDFQEWMK